MSKNRLYVMLAGLVVLALFASACGAATPAVDTAATEAAAAAEAGAASTQAAAADAAATQAVMDADATATQAAIDEIGTAAHPIKVLFVPSGGANVITTGGQVMADALKAATGLEFTVAVPTSYAATIEEVGASPTDTMV